MERKEKIATMDLALPAAKYDLRLNLSSERTVDANVPPSTLPNGWSSRRLKRRRSYSKRDGSFAWLLDVTEVEVSGNKFVQQRRPRSDLTDLTHVNHPAKRLLRHYKH